MLATGVSSPVETFRVRSYAKPLSDEFLERRFPLGATLQDVVESVVPDRQHWNRVVASIDGTRVDEKWWSRVRPKPGRVVVVRVVAGDLVSGLLALVGFLGSIPGVGAIAPALTKAGIAAGLGATGGTLTALAAASIIVSAGIIVGGTYFLANLALNALIDKPERLGEGATIRGASPTANGSGNQQLRFTPVWRNYGRNRLFPPFAAAPFSTVVAGKRLLNMVFATDGTNKVTEVKIGDTPVAEFLLDETNDIEIREGWSDDAAPALFTKTVSVQSLQLPFKTATLTDNQDQHDNGTLPYLIPGTETTLLTPNGTEAVQGITDFEVRTTGICDEFTVEVQFGSLIQLDDHAKRRNYSLLIQIDYKKASDPDIEANWIATGWDPVAKVFDANTTPGNDSAHIFPIRDPITGLLLTSSRRGSVTPTWLDDVPGWLFFGKTTDSFHQGWVIRPATKDSYDVRVRRLDIAQPLLHASGPFEQTVWLNTNFMNEGSNIFTSRADFNWTVLQSITHDQPFNLSRLTTVAMRVDSEKLAGLQGQVNFIAESYLPLIDEPVPGTYNVIDPDTLAPGARSVHLSRNASDAFLDCALRGEKPAVAADLDLASLKTWRDDIVTEARQTDIVFDFDLTKADGLRAIASNAMASFRLNANTISVSQEKLKTKLDGFFSPRDVLGFVGKKRFDELPHAMRVRFRNEDNEYAIDEMVVYRDGFNADGSGGKTQATIFADVDFDGRTVPKWVHDDARIMLAIGELRSETYSFTAVGLTHIGVDRGSLIEVAHDAVLVGLSFGRIVSVTLNGSSEVTTATLDEEVTFESGKSYGLRMWVNDGTDLVSIEEPINNPGPSTTKVVTFTTPIPAPSQPAAGDLFVYGEQGVEVDRMIVTRKVWSPDLSAKIECVPEAPAIYSAPSGSVPEVIPNIQTGPRVLNLIPPPPAIAEVASDESAILIDDGGVALPRISVLPVVQTTLPSNPPVLLQVRYRTADLEPLSLLTTVGPWRLTTTATEGSPIYIWPIESGERYELQARTLIADPNLPGLASSWSVPVIHTVIGTDTPPPDVLRLRLDNFDSLNWDFQTSPSERGGLAGFEVRMHQGSSFTWDDATSLHTNVVEPPFSISDSGDGTRTFLVKAINRIGQASVNAASLVSNIANTRENVLVTQDEHSGGFTGTITDGTVNGVSGDLEADENANMFWSSPATLMWDADMSTLMWGKAIYKEMVYEFTVSIATANVPSRLIIEKTIAASTFLIEYHRDETFWGAGASAHWGADGDPYWAAVAAGHALFPGLIEVEADSETYFFRVTTRSSKIQGVISALKVVTDVPDVIEYIEDFTVTAGHARLPITKTFRTIKTVELAVQDTQSSGAEIARVLDKNPTLGPDVETLNSSSVRVAEDVDAVVVGY